MELNINDISIAHLKEKVIKVFDSADECLKFAEQFKKEYGIELSCDTIYSFRPTIFRQGFREALLHAAEFGEIRIR